MEKSNAQLLQDLNELSKKINLDLFYVIRIGTSKIALQGYAKSYTIDSLKKLGYEFTYDGNFLEFKSEELSITLTF